MKKECTNWIRTKFGRKHGWTKFCYEDGVRVAGAYLRPCRAEDFYADTIQSRCLTAELVEFVDHGTKKQIRAMVSSNDPQQVYRYAEGFLRDTRKR